MYGCAREKKCFAKPRYQRRSRTRAFRKEESCMAEPLTSQEWVGAWLQKANHDLETAERALHAGSPITDTTAYHCPQAAEKALKAFLASRFEPVVKTHDLMDLLTRCADADVRFADWADRISELPAFGTVLR